jgi:hypothetical protein
MINKSTASNEPEVKLETVFEIGAEGGSICIYRQRDGSVDKFIMYHNEFDPLADDDETLVDVKKEYDTFNKAFQYIERFPWQSLYIKVVHKDFRNNITEKLKEKLKEKLSVPDELLNSEDLHYIEEINENLSRSLTDCVSS